MAGLDGTVTVPGAGKVPKKELVIGGAAVAALIVVYYVRKQKAGATTAAASSATSSDQYPPDGTTGNPQDLYSTDPATGATYGDEAAGSGGTFGAGGGLGGVTTSTYPWDGTVGNQSDPYSLDQAAGDTFGDLGLASGGTNANPTGGPPFSSNSAWTAWVTQQLQATNPNLDPGALTDALGLYLDGQPVSPAQKTYILDAEAVGGPPPVARANNYPPNIRLNGSKGPGPTSPPKAPNKKVPTVTGQRATPALADIDAAGFQGRTSPERNPQNEYTVTSQSPRGGTDAALGSTVTLSVKVINPPRQSTGPVRKAGK